MQFLFRAGSVRNTALLAAAILAAGTCRRIPAQEPQQSKPTVSADPLDAERLAIYKMILSAWMNDGKQLLNLSFETTPLSPDDRDCGGKAVSFEPVGNQVHRFREDDLAQIGGNLRLVDPRKQEREIRENDPGKKIKDGASVDDAVTNGFKHGLVKLSEIRFNASHDKAVVWYGFTCGGLCGNGGTVILEKKDGVWRRKATCSVWMSLVRRPTGPAELSPAEGC